MQTIPFLEGVRFLSHSSLKREIQLRTKDIEKIARNREFEERIENSIPFDELYPDEGDEF